LFKGLRGEPTGLKYARQQQDVLQLFGLSQRELTLLPWGQINITNHAGVMHFALTLTLCDFLSQIGQRHIGPVALN
jgi:hypothetical protein